MVLNGMAIRTTPQTPFGRWLLERFTEHHWESYRQAAAYTGISHTQLRSYVLGAVPSPPVLIRLAERFDVARAQLDALLGFGPVPGLHSGERGAIMIKTASATVQIDDPRLASYVYSKVSQWERMTEEERASTLADETDIPDPAVAARRGEDAASGEACARGPC
jgi:transcriptional regulator with XRE-family HTH domain